MRHFAVDSTLVLRFQNQFLITWKNPDFLICSKVEFHEPNSEPQY